MGRLVIDVATALAPGTRDIQQDSLVTDFPFGAGVGYMILADGMGGHISGEVASNIVVTEMFAELKFKASDLHNHEASIPAILRNAAISANECIREYVSQHPESYGMGSTVIAPVIVEDRLYWISVGDSPLYLFRDDELKQLNQDHSLKPEIDLMISTGMITEEQGRDHPDRNCLKSVIFGAEIAMIDCPETPFALRSDDIIIASSDGLQTLSDPQIADVVGENRDLSGHEIVQNLLSSVERLKDSDQDNISISVIKLCEQAAAEERDANVMAIREEQKGAAASSPTRVLQSVSGH